MKPIPPAHAPLRAFLPRPFPRSVSRLLAAMLGLAAASVHATNYEAESATLTGTPTATVVADGTATPPAGNPTNGTSGGYIFFDHDNAASFAVTLPSAGLYSVSVRAYVPNGYGAKNTRVVVDGTTLGEFSIPQADATTPVWGSIAIGNFSFTAGSHTIEVQNDWGYYYVDYVAVDALPAPVVGTKFEFENGVPAGGVAVSTSTGGFSGTGYVTGFTGNDAKIVLPVNLADTGQYRVYLGYTVSGEKKTRAVFNGATLGEWTLPASSGWAEAGPFPLTTAAGVSVLELQSDWGWYDLDYVRFEYVTPPVGLSFEAETGALFRTQLATATSGYSGTGYVTNFVQNPDAYVTIPVNIAQGGAYKLVVRAATPFGTKKTRVEVNGTGFGEADLNVQTASFTDFQGPTVFLREGINLVSLVADWGYYDIDRISFTAVTIPPFALNANPVDAAAAPEAISLYRYLVSQFGHKILSGQSEEVSDTPDAPFDHLLTLTGKQPAVRNQDMMFFSANTNPAWDRNTVGRGIAWHRTSKGVIAMQWHWFAPLGNSAFYTTSSTFDISQAVIPGTPEYIAAIADIDLIAAQLAKYAAARVPILWRPLHEAEGGWFWWGAKGPAPAKAMYRLIYDRLVRYHGLHNLIWVWNSKDPAWYPGDDVVDIVSIDLYNSAHDYSPAPGTFLDVSALGSYKKLVTMAENGPLPDVEAMADYQTVWSWFNTWNGDYIMNETYNTNDHIVTTFADARVVNLDALPDLRAGTAVTGFTSTSYNGTSIGLPPGDYLQQHLVIRGASGGNLQSFQVPAGYRLTIYSGDNFTGTSKAFSSNVTNLPTSGFSGPVKSIRIRRN